jgi:hypothetical protein
MVERCSAIAHSLICGYREAAGLSTPLRFGSFIKKVKYHAAVQMTVTSFRLCRRTTLFKLSGVSCTVIDHSLQVIHINRRIFPHILNKDGGARMAKFNTTNTIKTENRSHHEAYCMSKKEQLMSAVVNTMFGEEKYYGSTDNEIVQLATELCKKYPEFVSNLACFAREVFNMRSVSHVLTVVIAREASAYTRQTICGVVKRPDDITEIMACYKNMYGKPFPNALKRGMAEVIQNFDEYQIAKYNGSCKDVKFRDVLRITHPKSKSKEVEELFRKILNDTLEKPYTWETELSTRGNTKKVWDELIASGRVGYMALLRNLRNIIKSGTDITPVLAVLSDSVQVKKSKQLPFRFFSAYRMLEKEGLMTDEIHRALESAVTASVDNMEKIKGRTLIAIDVSGSMSARISAKSDISCADIASLLGAMANKLCEDATVCYFEASNYFYREYYRQRGMKFSDFMYTDCGYRIANYGKYDSVLESALQNSFAGGGTDLSLPMKYALKEDKGKFFKPFDRVIYFSDNECNCGLETTIQGLVDKYRRRYNKDFWVHGVDLQGYGTQQFCGAHFNLIAGWSDRVLSFINLAEAGMGSMVKEVENYNKTA